MLQNTNFEELQYMQLCGKLLRQAEEDPSNLIPDRTGTGRYGLFGAQMRFNLRDGRFPLLTTKKLFTKGIIHELLWLISGDTNIKYLTDNGVGIWDEWADEIGELGPVYGKQWRAWEGVEFDGSVRFIDQLQNVIDAIKNNPYSTRHIVTAWNPDQIGEMALPPCHTMFQFDVNNRRELNCQLYQRSADMFLGVPFNIASYALLTNLVAIVTGLKPGDFVHTLGNYHIYSNHLDQVREQLGRLPLTFPTVEINHRNSIDDFVFDDIKVLGYQAHPSIKGDVSV